MNKIEIILDRIEKSGNHIALERLGGMPSRTLAKHFAFVRGNKDGVKFPRQHSAKLVYALCQLSGVIEVDGWIVWTDGIAYTASKELSSKSKHENGVFTYSVTQERHLFDVVEFSEWLQE